VAYRAEKFSLFSSGAHVKRRNTPRSFPSIPLPSKKYVELYTTREVFRKTPLYVYVLAQCLNALYFFRLRGNEHEVSVLPSEGK
jgi:hypothetical protein